MSLYYKAAYFRRLYGCYRTSKTLILELVRLLGSTAYKLLAQPPKGTYHIPYKWRKN